MNSYVKVMRAVGGEFAKRKLRAAALPFIILAAVLVGVCLWLTTYNAWWWLLAAVAIAATILLILAYVAVILVIRALRPAMNKAQKSGVRDFVDKLERVTDSVGTPLPLVIFRVVRDMLWPRRESNYIKTVASDSTTLHKDLMTLQKLFNEK